MQRQNQYGGRSRGSFVSRGATFEPRVGALRGIHRVLEGGVVQLHHVGLALHPVPFEPAGEVDVDDVETARAEVEVERGDVDDHLVALLHLPEQNLVGPGRPPLARDLDQQRLGRNDGAAAQLQPTGHYSAAAATIRSQTSSILSRLCAGTTSSEVWTASVPLESRMLSKPSRRKTLASLPPPIATRWGSSPAPRSPCSANSSAAESFETW